MAWKTKTNNDTQHTCENAGRFGHLATKGDCKRCGRTSKQLTQVTGLTHIASAFLSIMHIAPPKLIQSALVVKCLILIN